MKNNTQPALKERIEKALEDFTKGRASMHVPPLDTDVDMVLAECSDRLSELEARCAALAVENAGLKAACERVSMWNDFPQVTLRSTGEVVPYAVAYGSNGERDYMRNIAATAVLKDTTATDAFLAEVRAQGVEMFAASAVDEVCLKISNAIINCYQDEMVGLDEAATICGEFAAQIRKGVQS